MADTNLMHKTSVTIYLCLVAVLSVSWFSGMWHLRDLCVAAIGYSAGYVLKSIGDSWEIENLQEQLDGLEQRLVAAQEQLNQCSIGPPV